MSTPAVERTTPTRDMGETNVNPGAGVQSESTNVNGTVAPRSGLRRGRSGSVTRSIILTAVDARRMEGGSSTGDASGGLNLRHVGPLFRMKLAEMSPTTSDSEAENTQVEGVDANGDPSRAASPPPNCAICLGRCKNKCFTDSCMHQFCFKCLCEWSKVKPECPLCKQTFKSIIHNVKAIDQFEEYHVQPPTVQIPHRPIEVTYRGLPHIFDGVVLESQHWEAAQARRNESSNPNRIRQSNGVYLTPFDNSHPISMRTHFRNRQLLDQQRETASEAVISSTTLSQLWRRFIYDRQLYALPVCDITGRYRECNARFYRDNPAQVHRLLPWINRDIVCLLRDSDQDTTSVLEIINSNLLTTNILSPAFRRRLQPYLGTKTAHFIHELHNFARSPFDMIGYDRAVHYLPQAAPQGSVIEFSSSGSSDDERHRQTPERENILSGNRTVRSIMAEYRLQPRPGTTGTTLDPIVDILSFTISTTGEGGDSRAVTVAGSGTQSAAMNLTTHNRASDEIIDLDDSDIVYEGAVPNTGSGAMSTASATTTTASATTTNASATTTTASASNASTAAASAEPTHSTNIIPLTVTDNIILTSGSSDECEFVLERKPPHLRTPELVSLHSDTDSDVIFVEETKASTREDGHVKKPQKSASANTDASTTQDLYNVGASTSSGLRSSGAGRGFKQMYEKRKSNSLPQSKRKRSLRSAKEERRTVRIGRHLFEGSSSTSYTPTSSSDSEGDSYETSRRKTLLKTNLDVQNAIEGIKRVENRTFNRKRGQTMNKPQKRELKKQRHEEISSESEDSSDDTKCLDELRKKLLALKNERDREENKQSPVNNSTTEVQHAKSEPIAEEESNHSAHISDEIMTNFDGNHHPLRMELEYSNHVSEVAGEAASTPTFGASSINATEEPVEHVGNGEDNTFSSISHITSATNTSANRDGRSQSRASVNSSDSNENSESTRSTPSSSTSSFSMNSTSSCDEGEDNSNNVRNTSADLGIQQLLDAASLGDPWLVNEMNNTFGVNGEQERVVDEVSFPVDISGLFLNHDTNLALPFTYGQSEEDDVI